MISTPFQKDTKNPITDLVPLCRYPPLTEKGLTQEEVEARSGFSQQCLSGVERGQRNPTIITLYELSQALGVSHLDLIKDLGPKNR